MLLAPSGTQPRRLRRVVLDPGVLVSAVITPLGPPADILRAIREERLALVVSPHLLAELLEVLRREKFRTYLSAEEADEYVAGLASRADTIADPESPPRVVRDAKDDYLVALARVAEVDALVSGDSDLLSLDPIEPPIVTPASLAAGLTAE